MTDLEQLENARVAFGYHPDSEMDLPQMIFELRNRERELFHENTKLVNRLVELKDKVRELEQINKNQMDGNTVLINRILDLEAKSK